MAVAEREHGIACKTPWRTLRRNQFGVGRKEVFQPRLPARIAVRRGARNVVIARREEIGNAAFLRQPIDQVNEARVPLPPDPAAGHSVSGLDYETNREGGLLKLFDRSERRVDDQRVLVLKLESVATPARVAVDDEGEPVDPGRIFFTRKRRPRGFDRAHRLVDCFRRQGGLLLSCRLLLLLRRLCLRSLSRRERENAKQRVGKCEKLSEHILSYLF